MGLITLGPKLEKGPQRFLNDSLGTFEFQNDVVIAPIFLKSSITLGRPTNG